MPGPLAASQALWKLKAPADEVLPTLTALLSHELITIRTGALNSIAQMGKAAVSIGSNVKRLTSDDNELVRRAATVALKRITNPSAASQASTSLR